jgi:hypothetical protein
MHREGGRIVGAPAGWAICPALDHMPMKKVHQQGDMAAQGSLKGWISRIPLHHVTYRIWSPGHPAFICT